MSKLFFILGFLLPLPAYFNDGVAGFVQNLSGSLWGNWFSNFGFITYPLYLAMFTVPIFLIISILGTKLRPELGKKKIFLTLLYGFLVSSGVFLFFAVIAISQFQFGF